MFIIIAIVTLIGFDARDEYDPMGIYFKGRIVNLKTQKPLKKTSIYMNFQKMDEVDFYADRVLTGCDKTNSKGEFLLLTFIDKNDLQTWLKVNEFAQVNILTPNLDTTMEWDTIDLGAIYLVPYDMELEVEAYNMPKAKRPAKEKYRKYSIKEVDSIFNHSTTDYRMELNEIDTVRDAMTRYNFGQDKPRGTTVKHYKQITFRKVVK